MSKTSQIALIHFAKGVEPTEGQDVSFDALGAKGGGLVEMAALGMPVPPGFLFPVSVGARAIHVLETEAGKETFSTEIRPICSAGSRSCKKQSARTFGAGPDPLLVSVRSGAAVSMPGMMDSVLNVGLTRAITEQWAASADNPSFVWDNYRRSLQSHAQVVLGLAADDFELITEDALAEARLEAVSEMPLDLLEAVCTAFEETIEVSHPGFAEQTTRPRLEQAVLSVFASWNTSRARRFRQMHGMGDDGGSAAIVQQMVFGNRDAASCTGVYFTRNPSTGDNTPFGEYLPQAQGEESRRASARRWN